ncbi:hypothetical protein [Ekhidna sp.]|uniref:hypothetical protein n=1 Tax=Ekhidna sp. TaxID=2608089 RepID=UPI0032993397
MIQFALILSLALFGTSFESSKSMSTLPSIEFSKPILEFESGQPVYPKGTKAFLRNLPSDKSRVVINDKVDKVLKTRRVEVSKLVELSEGTYTVMIETRNGAIETFGFTIK